MNGSVETHPFIPRLLHTQIAKFTFAFSTQENDILAASKAKDLSLLLPSLSCLSFPKRNLLVPAPIPVRFRTPDFAAGHFLQAAHPMNQFRSTTYTVTQLAFHMHPP